jgi:hypothetical protein
MSANEQQQQQQQQQQQHHTYVLDIAATGTGKRYSCQIVKKVEFSGQIFK